MQQHHTESFSGLILGLPQAVSEVCASDWSGCMRIKMLNYSLLQLTYWESARPKFD